MAEMDLNCMGTTVTISQTRDEERLKEAELIINIGKSPRTTVYCVETPSVQQQPSMNSVAVGTDSWNPADQQEFVIPISGSKNWPSHTVVAGTSSADYSQSGVDVDVGSETENQRTESEAETQMEAGPSSLGNQTEAGNQSEIDVSSSSVKAHRVRSRPGMKIRHVYRCYICKMDFNTMEELLKHRMDHRTYICFTCDMSFPDNKQLATHQQEHLQLEVRSYRCNMCLEVFNDIDMLNLHKKIHESEGPFVCDICSLVFSVKRAFLNHISGHGSGDMKRKRLEVRCEVCKKVFPEANKLQRHMLYHNNIRQFACPLCGRDFIEKAKLQRHMIVHSGLRDFECPVCKKRFTLKHNMVQHLNIHKGVKPHVCPICNKGFTQKVVMQRHIKNVHEPLQS